MLRAQARVRTVQLLDRFPPRSPSSPPRTHVEVLVMPARPRRRGQDPDRGEELEVSGVVVPLRRGADSALVAMAVGSLAVTLALASLLVLVLADPGVRTRPSCPRARAIRPGTPEPGGIVIPEQSFGF